MAMEVHAYCGCVSEFMGVYGSLWALISIYEYLWGIRVSIGVLTVWVFMDLGIYVSGGIWVCRYVCGYLSVSMVGYA